MFGGHLLCICNRGSGFGVNLVIAVMSLHDRSCTESGSQSAILLCRRSAQLHTIATRPKLGANGRAPTARCLLRLQRAQPKGAAWLEGCAALVNLFQGQHVAAGPKAGFEASRILLWQVRATHFGGGCREIVVERSILDRDTIRFGSQEAEPDPRRPIVRGHPNGASVMP